MNQEILQQALVIYRKLKVAKQEVKRLETEIAPFKSKLKEAMGLAGKKLFECAEGYAKWNENPGKTKWDVEALEKELGEDANNFRTIGKDAPFVKFGLYEPTNQE